MSAGALKTRDSDSESLRKKRLVVGAIAALKLAVQPPAFDNLSNIVAYLEWGMAIEEEDLDFVRHATAELATSFTDPRDHNLHAALNGLLQAIEANRARTVALEAGLARLKRDRH